MKRFKKALKVFSIIIILLIVIISLIPQIFHEKIEGVALQEIRKQVNCEVAFAHLDISIWRNFPNLTVILKDYSISNKREKADTLLKGERIDCVVDAIDYITDSHFSLKRLKFYKPVANVWIDKEGNKNFLILKTDTTNTQSDTSNFSLHLSHIELADAMISYTDQQSDLKVSLNDLDFEGSGEMVAHIFDLDTKINIASTNIESGGKTICKDKECNIKSILTINSVNNNYTLKECKLKLNRLVLDAKGAIQVDSNRIGIDVNFNSSKSEIKDFLSLVSFLKDDLDRIETAGNIQFSGFSKGYYVPGTDTVPQFKAALEVSDGKFKTDTLPNEIKNIHLDVVIENTTGLLDSTEFRLDTIFCQLEEHTIEGYAHIHGLKNLLIDSKIKGSIHLDEILKVYPVKGIDADGEITFDVAVDGRYQSLEGAKEIPHIDFDIDVQKGRFKYDSLPESISEVNFCSKGHIEQGKLDDAEILISKLSLLLGDDPIQGNFKIKGLTNPKIESSFEAAIHLEDMNKFYPITSMDMRGAFNINARVNGTYNSSTGEFPKVNAICSLKNAYLKTESYPKPVEDLNLDVEFKNSTGAIADTKLLIKQCHFTLEKDSFQLLGQLEDFKNYGYDLKIKGLVDLGKITKIYPIEELTLLGAVRTDVEVKGKINDLEKGNYEKTKASGSLDLHGLYIETSYLPKPVEVKSGSVILSPEVIVLKDLDLDCGKSCFKVTGKMKDYFCFFKDDGDLVEANLNLDADTLDLNEWKEMFTAGDPESTQSSASGVWKIPTSIDFDFDSEIKYLRYDDMHIKNLKGEITVKDGVLSMNETGFNTLDALFAIGGHYDTRDIKHPIFDFDIDIEKLDIQKAYNGLTLIRQLAPAASGTEGTFSIKYKIKGELDSIMNPKLPTLVGGGELRIINANINGMKVFDELSKAAKKDVKDPHLKEFTLVSEIRNNRLYLKPFSIKISGFHTEIEGVNDINGPISYQIKMELLPIEKLKVPFHVSGTYDNPKVALGKGAKLPEDSTSLKTAMQ